MVAGAKKAKADGPIRYGMVGGGQGAFIGAVHRIAARMDGHFELVAGALSSQKKRALESAKELGLDPSRSYGTYEEMAKAEAAREDGIEAVAIVTPNHMHFPIAKAFIQAGIHVICDKPLTSTLADAKKLQKLQEKSDKLFVLTHNYTGYPMIRQAREMIAKGKLGTLRVLKAEYAPGNENGLTLRVYGTKGGLEWSQENPNQLWYTPLGQPKQLITRGGAGSGDAAARMTRIPPGHPEGYLEGFANIYSEAALAIRAKRRKSGKVPKNVHFPTIEDGVKGMKFIDACVKSSGKNSAWVKL